MDPRELTFVIPTYRLRDVGEAVEESDQHFWRNGHTVRIVVFDDSIPANQQKHYPLLEQTRTSRRRQRSGRPGSALALLLVEEIAVAHGGCLVVDSKADRRDHFTQVSFTIPASVD